MNLAVPIPVIAVCIATFHREELLGQLIERLISQLTDGLFAFTIVVVDNSAEKSAMQVVQSWQSQYSESHWVVISYSHQPVKNIALTRNMAIDNACGDYLAFIDDDEIPEKDWLLRLYQALLTFDCDGVHGPVVSCLIGDVPSWISNSGYFERESHPTGYCGYYTLATNNCLIRSSICFDHGQRFDGRYGLSGGEDSQFFYRLQRAGFRFCWCDEAVVHEKVPDSRTNLGWLTRRFFRTGNTYVRVRLEDSRWISSAYYFFKAVVKIFGYAACLPPFLLLYAWKPELFYLAVRKMFMSVGELYALTGGIYSEYK